MLCLQTKNTPLHIVSRDGRMEIVKSLIAAHANPNIKNDEGSTALHEACRNGKTAIVQLLLEAGAEIDSQDQVGSIVLLLIIGLLAF